jgi:hypothetical protein
MKKYTIAPSAIIDIDEITVYIAQEVARSLSILLYFKEFQEQL